MKYIHFEDGRDVISVETYRFNGKRKYLYQYGASIAFSSNYPLSHAEISLRVRKREKNT